MERANLKEFQQKLLEIGTSGLPPDEYKFMVESVTALYEMMRASEEFPIALFRVGIISTMLVPLCRRRELINSLIERYN